MATETVTGPPEPLCNDAWRLRVSVDAANEIWSIADLLQRELEAGTAVHGLAIRLEILSSVVTDALHGRVETADQVEERLYGPAHIRRSIEDEVLL